jgi:glycosyltransferase involved in cell wall biosynthesis
MVEALATPDPQKAWIPMATRRAMQLCGREQFDAVLVSVPPFSSLQVGVELKRRFPHLTLISDFRDEWVGYYLAELGPAPSPYRLRVAESHERAAVEASDYVVAVTEMQKDSIRGRYPNEPAGKFLTIHNGYDPEVFAALQSRPHGGSRLRVGYVGTIYGHDVSSPRPWIEALNGLVPDEMDRIETHFVGRVEPDAAAVLERARTPISCTGFLSQRAALEEMMQCDALLLIVANMNALTGKVFEYLASGKPILCLTLPGSVAAKVIEETQSGWWADYRDPEAVRELVRRAVEWKRTGEGLQRDAKRIEAFSRPALVAELVRLTGLGSPILLEL